MSLSETRLAAAIVAELQAAGFNVEDGPKLGSTGKTGVKVIVEAIAAGTVTELDANWDGEGGGSGPATSPVIWTQSAAAAIWGPPGGIPHSFGRRANVITYDSSGRRIIGAVAETTIGLVVPSFAGPFSGQAILS